MTSCARGAASGDQPALGPSIGGSGRLLREFLVCDAAYRKRLGLHPRRRLAAIPLRFWKRMASPTPRRSQSRSRKAGSAKKRRKMSGTRSGDEGVKACGVTPGDRSTGFLDARACLPILVFVVYWSWTTFYIAAARRRLGDQLGGPDGSLDIEDDPARSSGPSSAIPAWKPAEVRMTGIDARSKTLKPAYVSRVVRELLIEADRDILVEDGPRRDLVRISFRCCRSGGWAFAAVPGRRRGDLARRHGTWLRTRAQARSRRCSCRGGSRQSEPWPLSCSPSVMEAIAAVTGARGVMGVDSDAGSTRRRARSEARKAIA